jgi:predicted nucleic acid-binding protein
MLSLFVDTWAWLTLRDRQEARHQEVKAFYCRFRGENGRLCTTDYVLDEAFTLLFRRLPFSQARESLDILNKAIQEGYLQLEWITSERFEQAKRLRLRFQDKPRISFTDLTSMVVMDELGITDILTEDAHFMQVGMGFKLVP